MSGSPAGWGRLVEFASDGSGRPDAATWQYQLRERSGPSGQARGTVRSRAELTFGLRELQRPLTRCRFGHLQRPSQGRARRTLPWHTPLRPPPRPGCDSIAQANAASRPARLVEPAGRETASTCRAQSCVRHCESRPADDPPAASSRHTTALAVLQIRGAARATVQLRIGLRPQPVAWLRFPLQVGLRRRRRKLQCRQHRSALIRGQAPAIESSNDHALCGRLFMTGKGYAASSADDSYDAFHVPRHMNRLGHGSAAARRLTSKLAGIVDADNEQESRNMPVEHPRALHFGRASPPLRSRWVRHDGRTRAR